MRPGSSLSKKLIGWWNEARDYASENRQEMATDEDFVDNEQWTQDEKCIMESRGQMPLVYNEIRLSVLWLTGTEKRTKIDWSVIPREPDDETGAETKTQILKYLSDANRFPFERSAAFEEAVRAGCGWLETGIKHDGNEPIYIGHESWRNVWRDPMNRKPDQSDSRFIIRTKVFDLDIAQAKFPKHAERLRWEADHFDQLSWQNQDIEIDGHANRRHTSVLPGDSDFDRPVIRLFECWYRTIENVPLMRGAFSGQIFNDKAAAHRKAVEDGRSYILSDQPRLIVRVAVFTLGGYVLFDDRSPYTHNQFPFIPIFCYIRAKDGQPYGVPRPGRDPQIDLNKRRSKALFAISTNKVVADDDSVADQEKFEREAARPDQVVWKKRGSEIQFINNFQLADAHVNFALQDSEFIRQISGVTGENLGLDTNAISGKAIIAKQQQGSVTSAGLFDNLRLATQLAGEQLLSLVEQFYDQERVIRVIGAKQKTEFLPINRALPDGTVLNDITARQADFKVSEQDFHESYRQAMFETTLDVVAKQPPELAIQLLDLVFEFSDLPNKDEIVRRIRQLNGHTDPADPQAQQDAERAAADKAQQAQQAQMLESHRVMAETELKTAQADKAKADAEKSRIDARVSLINALHPPEPKLTSNPKGNRSGNI